MATKLTRTNAIVFGAHEGATAVPVLSAKSLGSSSLAFIQSQLAASNFKGKDSDVRVLYAVPGLEQPVVSIVGLGKPSTDANAAAETARKAAFTAVSALRALGKHQDIHVKFDNLGHGVGTSEGAHLSTYSYDQLKSAALKASPVTVSPIEGAFEKNAWEHGQILADSQNRARIFMETPANLMTPVIFAQCTVEMFKDIPNVTVHVRDEKFLAEHKMGSFLSVARGSDEPPRMVEVHYNGGPAGQKPLAFVGKGITFDTGGISLKPAADMAAMKGDMGGAACVISATYGIAKLGLPVNVVTTVALSENMPSGKATKPGDVVYAMNGKSIEVDNTDAEGRLVLADAIYYTSTKYNPSSLVELSTLTGAMVIALGTGFAGVFSTHDDLWNKLQVAGEKAGDPFWRMPLHSKYKKQISSNVADLKNVGGRMAGSCTAAIFLKEFIPTLPVPEGSDDTPELAHSYAHVDIAVERAALQLNALVDQFPLEESPVAERMLHIFSILMPPKWELERELGERFAGLGAIRSALQIFERLEMWEEVVSCHQMLEETQKADAIVCNLLKETPDSPKLLCLLGDIRNEIEHYEKAWEVSGNRYSRAMRSLGSHYFKKQDMRRSVDCYRLALNINPLFENSWFMMGCGALHIEDFDTAATAFNRVTVLNPENGEAWNNLASVYIKQRRLREAFNCLRESLRHNFETSNIWENYLFVSVDIGEFSESIRSFERILEIRGDRSESKGAVIDLEVLDIVSLAVINNQLDAQGEPSSYLAPKLAKLLDAATSKLSSPRLFSICARFEQFREHYRRALDYYQKAFRAVLHHPDLSTDETVFKQLVEYTMQLVRAFAELGPLQEEVRVGGSVEPVCKDWAYQTRQALKSVVGRTKETYDGTEDYDKLVEQLQAAKSL
eukprot:jgi/Hompol1/328/HPOL_001393-RA